MAGLSRLNGGAALHGAPATTLRFGLRFGLLVATVVAVHMLSIAWLARQLEISAFLRPMATPMFTRLLTPEAPVVPVQATAPAAAPSPRVHRSTVRSVAAAQAPAAKADAPSTDSAAPVPVPAVPDPPVAAASSPTPSSPSSPVAGAAPALPNLVPPGAVAAAPVQPASAPVAVASASGSSNAVSLDSWPADTRLNYRLSGNFRGEIAGSARVQWQRQGDKYQTRVDIDVTLLASLVLTSQGEVAAGGLMPRVYEEQRRSGPRGVRLGDSNVTLNDGRVVPRPAGVQDTASQFVELSHRFATGAEALQVGRSVDIWMARPGAVDLWTYDIVDREMLKTAGLGTVEAFHLKPRPIANPRGNITAEMWFAPSLQFLPVRIKVSMGDATYVDLMVEKIEQR